jgi:small subunit ribosomal protein S2
MPFVTERWLGGTLTNFRQIKETLKRFKSLKDQRDKGELKKYTKKEQLMIQWEIQDMEKRIGGIESLAKIPEAMFVIDIRTEKTAVREANATGTKVFAVCDTNVNPEGVDFIIPANDDSVRGIELLCKVVCEAVKEGKSSASPTS